jgi:glycerophosphoryl diester phosphodiesterase
MHTPQIFAHRGAKEIAPENTLPAFEEALRMGVQGIELDVHRTRDGALVVIHDFTVDATTDGSGAVGDMSLAQIRALDAGAHLDPRFAGTPVPTLDEVFDLVGHACVVNVEIKTLDHYGGDQAEPLVEFIRRRNVVDQVLVSSFNPIALLKVRSLDHAIRLAFLHMPDLPDFLRQTWCGRLFAPVAFHPHFSGVDQAYMAWARGQGLQVNTWTVNDAAEARRVAALGVDVIMTDAPDRVAAALAAADQQP